jgi:small subunit ribosomal protein S2
MTLPNYSLRQLLEAGVHFGHQTHRWNPLMDEYIFGSRNGIHILDLTQTMTMLSTALDAIHKVVSKGGSILFVGTKRQAQFPISDAAQKCAQYYINYRWLGGTLTNWKTVSNSIVRLKELDQLGLEELDGYTKKERLNIEKEHGKLKLSLGGIRDMKNLPSMIFVVDTNKESIAIKEAKKIGIPVVAVLDSNSSTDGVNFPIPGNDDASRAISLYCELVSQTILDGMESQLGSAGIDIGEALETPAETMPEHKEADTDLEAKRVETDSGTSDDKVKKANLNTDQEASVEEREKVITEIEASTINAVPEQESNQNESDE